MTLCIGQLIPLLGTMLGQNLLADAEVLEYVF